MNLTPEQIEYIEVEYTERLTDCLEDNNIDYEPFIQKVKEADKSTTEAFITLFKEIHETLKDKHSITEMFIQDDVFNNLLESLKEE